MTRHYVEEPFEGEPPNVRHGDIVWCPADGFWLRKVAMSEPRYDHDASFGPTVGLSVQVAPLGGPEGVYQHGGRWLRHGRREVFLHNWPAKDVRPDSEEPPGPLRQAGAA